MGELIAILYVIALTALIYGIYPFLLVTQRKKPISKSTVRAHMVVSTAAVGLLLFILEEQGGYRGSMAPALVWGLIYYKAVLSRFRKRGLLLEIKPPQETVPTGGMEADKKPSASSVPKKTKAPREVKLQYGNGFNVLKPKPDGIVTDVLTVYRTPKKLKLALVLLSVLLTASVVCNVYQYGEARSTKAEYNASLGEADVKEQVQSSAVNSAEQYKKILAQNKVELIIANGRTPSEAELSAAGLTMDYAISEYANYKRTWRSIIDPYPYWEWDSTWMEYYTK